MRNYYKITSFLSIGLGALASILCVFPAYLKFALMLSILGFIASTFNIFINTRYYFSKSAVSPGFYGTILSSLPILLMLYFIFIAKN